MRAASQSRLAEPKNATRRQAIEATKSFRNRRAGAGPRGRIGAGNTMVRPNGLGGYNAYNPDGTTTMIRPNGLVVLLYGLTARP